MKLSIIICTYNRAEILEVCLQHVFSDISGRGDIEVLVVDNASTDDTAAVVERYGRQSRVMRYIKEPTVGLSYARNRGAEEASADWLLFIDDDTKLRLGNTDSVLDTIEKYDFEMFTGVWQAWHRTAPPIWLPESTGTYYLRGSNEVRDIGADYVTGLVMAMRKASLVDVGLFPTDLGMRGDQVAYGEESYVEEQMKAKGYRVGINPNLVVDHLVGRHKYDLSWHLSAAYQKGVSNMIIYPKQSKILISIRLLFLLLLGWVRPFIRLLIDKSFYRQNFIIRYWGAIKYRLGQLIG